MSVFHQLSAGKSGHAAAAGRVTGAGTAFLWWCRLCRWCFFLWCLWCFLWWCPCRCAAEAASGTSVPAKATDSASSAVRVSLRKRDIPETVRQPSGAVSATAYRLRFSRGLTCRSMGVPTKPNSSRRRRSMKRS